MAEWVVGTQDWELNTHQNDFIPVLTKDSPLVMENDDLMNE